MQSFAFLAIRRAALPAVLIAAATFAACDTSDSSAPLPVSPNAAKADLSPGTHLQYGPAVQVGKGRARTYVVVDARRDAPIELGVALDSTAMYELPAPMVGMPGHGDMHEYLLKLPQLAPAPYTFVELDWNPSGHGAPYTAPHFDFHFYTIDIEQRNAITPNDPQWAAKAANFPAPEYLRPNYVCPCTLLNIPPADMAVPRMGLHWIDINAPEFRGVPFTTTMINGTWDGKVIFQEPMITREFIMSKTDTTIALAQAQRAAQPGWYPGAYGIQYDAKAREYRIALSNFKFLK
jgi:hypothetical protein